ncbi:helix-turn-helix transcriptional regulator [Olivibacter sp. SDN3]|uniref:helix-turn-helix domain-containing protein n=1 Tax=Olivibacter sp. SDN3 TaxID=2764720 RepID=UPI0016516682|nr:helix-turn-helix transcriptional regulator [Olivibacter sp. SDN3]QNL48129.1 helix-turn-helix transcriptional regulator [Olivibacter sp. SDN3]
MAKSTPYRIKSITEIHRLMGMPKPLHPLIGWVDLSKMPKDSGIDAVIFELYVITMKRGCDKLLYGQQKYDFNEGVLAFLSPGQILSGEAGGVPVNLEGWMLFIHPDFFWGTTLAAKIRKYEYFDYAVSEALFLSDREEAIINDIVKNIQHEYQSNIDKFSQDIILSHVETLLNYAERFYQRQFITRSITNHHVLDRLETLLTDYFDNDNLITRGLPTVQYISNNLNISPTYLRGLLKSLTGLNTQQHIHEKLIEKAKHKLSTTELSVSEIAYELGFEHPQSFNKLFKSKAKVSPLEFRARFN